MSALDEIARLHVAYETLPFCSHCRMAWPCPTRRLCDEADEGPSPWKAAINMALDRDRWRADAERLAAAARRVSDDYRSVARGTSGINDLCSALAAHDALVDGAGQ